MDILDYSYFIKTKRGEHSGRTLYAVYRTPKVQNADNPDPDEFVDGWFTIRSEAKAALASKEAAKQRRIDELEGVKPRPSGQATWAAQVADAAKR